MANEFLNNYNTGRRFVSHANVDYAVPEFLSEKFDNIPSAKDFNASFIPAITDETPLWWKMGIDIPLTKREKKLEAKAVAEKNEAIARQRERILDATEQYMTTLKEKEAEFAKHSRMIEKESEEKFRQIEMHEQNLKLRYQQDLLELEAKIQAERHERELLKKETEKLAQMNELQIRADILEEDASRVIYDMNNELEETRAQNEILKKNLIQRYSEMGIAYTPPKKDAERVIIPKKLVFEKFNHSNILEIRSLTFSNKESGMNEFENISFDVRRNGKTVVYSSPNVISCIVSAVMKTYPSYMTVTSGEIRLDGNVDSELGRDDYKKVVNEKILNVSYIADRFARTAKSMKKVFKTELNSLFEELCGKLDIDISVLNEKLSLLSESIRMKLAIAFALSQKAELIICESLEDELDQQDCVTFAETLNSIEFDNNAILILTSEKACVKKLHDINFYCLA